MFVFVFRDIKQEGHTIWLDNFSKIRAMQVPDINMGAWRNCLWTGRALRKSRVPVTMDLEESKEGIIPAMPDDLYGMLPVFKKLFVLHNPQEDTSMMRYRTSLVTNLDVRNIPLKPAARMLSQERHRTAITSGCDRLDNLFPDKIISVNIGSNLGFMRILRNHYEDKQQHTGNCQEYSSFNADIDIFDRFLKVCYESACVCSNQRALSHNVSRTCFNYAPLS